MPARVAYVGDFFGPSGYALEQSAAESNGAEFIRSNAEKDDDLFAICATAKIVVIESAKLPITSSLMERLGSASMIMRAGTGFDNVDVAAATRLGIVISNAATYCSEEVSDHAAALILACARRIVFLDRRVRAGEWDNAELAFELRRLRAQTVGLVGFGRIARLVSQKLSGFGMRILASDPQIPVSEASSRGVELLPLEEMLAKADYVSVHAALSPSTLQLFNADRLGRMKPGAFLINTSRGALIDEPALVATLRSGHLAGAALDVTAVEPLPAESDLWKLPNVIVTPHFASESSDANEELHRTIARSIDAVLTGYWPEFPVNPEVGPRERLRPWVEREKQLEADLRGEKHT